MRSKNRSWMPHGGLEAAKESHCFRNNQQSAGTACRLRHRFKVHKAIVICFEMKGGLRTRWNGKNIPDARGLPQHACCAPSFYLLLINLASIFLRITSLYKRPLSSSPIYLCTPHVRLTSSSLFLHPKVLTCRRRWSGGGRASAFKSSLNCLF